MLDYIVPGTILWDNLSQLPRKTSIISKEVKFTAPSRVNIEILDFTEMRPNIGGMHCNSGSVSFGIGLYSTVKVQFLDKPEIIVENCKHKNQLRHYALIMSELTNYNGGFIIEAEPNQYEHVGLGSTASLNHAVLNAINVGLGKPFSDREIVKIGAWNYVETGNDGNLYPGQSTGASGWIALKGGLCIISSDAELVFRVQIPDDLKVVVGLPDLSRIFQDSKTKGVDDSSVELPFLKKLYFYERFNSGKICHWVLMRLMPLLLQNNYHDIGELIWDMVVTNSKGIATILAHNTLYPIECLMDLRKTGAEVSFLSSVGPGIVTLCTSKYLNAVKKILKLHKCRILMFNIDNYGGAVDNHRNTHQS